MNGQNTELAEATIVVKTEICSDDENEFNKTTEEFRINNYDVQKEMNIENSEVNFAEKPIVIKTEVTDLEYSLQKSVEVFDCKIEDGVQQNMDAKRSGFVPKPLIKSEISIDDEYNFPKSLEGFGYKFNEDGKLLNIETGEPFLYEEKKDDHIHNQRRYEAVGDLVTSYVYDLLMGEGGLKKLILPLDANDLEPTTFIFHSDDAFTNEKLVILIHGSGVVRAGQWARRLVINDCLNSGTQLPFIKRAKGLGYGVIVLNTNDNSREVNGVFQKIRANETAEKHANYVWKNLILQKAAAKYIAIIAHSYGGIVTVNMCNEFPESFEERVMAVAFTDSPHSLAGQNTPPHFMQWFQKIARNWVSSHSTLDTPIAQCDIHEIKCVSAGTQRHDETSRKSFASIYDFIDSQYRKALAKAYEKENTNS